jgi:phospholipid/cholesterol/gamma-HCH transport system permease protein
MVALPLLTVYADIIGVLGGMVMAQTQLDVGFVDFLDRFDDAIKLNSFMVGLGKAPVFAVIIALVGCFQGFRVSGSADSVGRHTTISVVQAIFLVIVFDALFSVIFSWLKI